MLESAETGFRSHTGGLRWALMGLTLLAVWVTTAAWSWALMLSLPVVCGTLALNFFAPAALKRWLADGRLLAVDVTIVGLALVGTGRFRPPVLLVLFAIALAATAFGERRRTLLAAGAVTACLGTLSVGGLPEALRVVAADVFFAPLLAVAALHLGALGEQLGAARAEDAPAERDELWTLLHITESITGTLGLNQVMHAIVERVGELVDTPSCSILLAENLSSDCTVMASKGHPEADMMELDLAKYPEVRLAMVTSRPVVVDDVASHPLVAPVRHVLIEQGYRSMLVLPLLFGREVLGALFLKSKHEGAFTPEVQRFCKVVAGASANALKNALLYRDVRREAEGHRETGEKLRRILDGTPDMIVATDSGGLIAELNRGAEEMTGRRAEDVRGRDLASLLGCEPPAEAGADVAFSRPDGESVEVSLVSAPLSGGEGGPAGRVWIGRDVTKLRRVERRLAQAERLSSLGEIVAGVAHELNNPLSGVIGYAELLRKNASDPEQIQDLQRIVESARRCERIVFKLLGFARQQPSAKRFQSLNDTVSKVVDLKSYHLRSSQVETVLELEPDLPRTCFDAIQIEQVVLNLLNNAEQAIASIRRGGRIVMRTGRQGERVFVEVVDNGPGVHPSAAERVFDPFFTTKELGQGTGLGLSVSYGIVQDHGGEIELTPRPPHQGACFRVWLPIVEGPEPDVEAGGGSGEISATALAGCKILVAEDEPMVLELLARLLSQDGAEVTQARDGREAWDRMHEADYDLVVADLRMPNLDGRELYELVAEERPEMLRRFVFATGDLMRAETLAFLEGLPNRILTKPLQQDIIRRVLSQALTASA